MSNGITRFPNTNPVQFYDPTKSQSDRYHTKHRFDNWAHEDTLASSPTYTEDAVAYYQPFEINDIISIQVRHNGLQPKLFFQDKDGNFINDSGTGAPASIEFNASYYYDYGEPDIAPDGTSTPMYVHELHFQFGQLTGTIIPTTPDFYRLVVRTYFGSLSTYDDHYSEWIDLKDEHKGTLFIEYNNSFNDFETIFEQLNPRFGIRCYGAIHNYESGAVVSGYTNQKEEFTPLTTIPYNTYMLSIGGAKGCPDWLQKKINYVFACDIVKVDNKLFTKDDGAKFEIQRPDSRYPLTGINIKIREGESIHAQISRPSGTISLNAVATHPKFLHNISLYNGVSYIILSENRIIENQSDGETAAAYYNSHKSTFGLFGTFSYVSGILQYEPASGEIYYGSSEEYPIYFNLDIDTNYDNQDFSITYQGGGFGIDWDDGNLSYLAPLGYQETTTHNYAVNDTYTIRVFHANETIDYRFLVPYQSGSGARLTNITGDVPTMLQYHTISGHTLSSSFDLSYLQNAAQNLISLVIYNSGLTHPFTGGVFALGGTGRWSALKNINLQYNNLSQTGVDTVFNEFYNNAYYGRFAPGNFFNTQNQSPTAAPTGTSSTARAALTAQFWTITTD